ncbi:hypothetical protein AB6A40_009312 [Gnathostoma spinigerum]|uniref:Uncharacterized protein n=1 Tax=Gnathostoma spinigerum TaxID=75299 RepID=A0ABD6EZM4_9BILA
MTQEHVQWKLNLISSMTDDSVLPQLLLISYYIRYLKPPQCGPRPKEHCHDWYMRGRSPSFEDQSGSCVSESEALDPFFPVPFEFDHQRGICDVKPSGYFASA